MKRSFVFIMCIFLSISSLLASEKLYSLKGFVTDDKGVGLIGATIQVIGTSRGTMVSQASGEFEVVNIPINAREMKVSFIGCASVTFIVTNIDSVYNISMIAEEINLDGVMVCGYRSVNFTEYNYTQNESYAKINPNEFQSVIGNPLSTFSADVDRAAYSNIRRFINTGEEIPKDAVKIEEMINYFEYDYPQPENGEKFTISTEYSYCPWNSKNTILHIGIQGLELPEEDLPPSHLVFLIDVSGSMSDFNKLPLVQKSMKMLINKLGEEDRISIVTYAGSDAVICENISADRNTYLNDIIDNFESGGSTHGSQGIITAYEIAEKHFIRKGNNRVILATDGDFNVGITNEEDLKELITENAKKDIYLSCLGYGMGNYKETTIETLSQFGNGNYAYIDNLNEARKQLVTEMGGTLFAIAKDVKIQVEFNPQYVTSYRLVGYENRLLNDEDFEDDTKDAGDIGSGHTVTVIYEIIPNKNNEIETVESRYIVNRAKDDEEYNKELGLIKIRYKDIDSKKSKLISKIVSPEESYFDDISENARFASSVATFGMILRHSKYLRDVEISRFIKQIENSIIYDKEGYRKEFLNLVKTYMD